MIKSPYRSVIEKYPVAKLPEEIAGAIDRSSYVKIVLSLLDDEGAPVNRHVFLDRQPEEPASPEIIDDYIRWLRGD